jgi:hypothetical protein
VLTVNRQRGLVCQGNLTGRGNSFRQAEIQNLGMAALGDEDIRRLYVALGNPFGMRGVKSIGDFNR